MEIKVKEKYREKERNKELIERKTGVKFVQFCCVEGGQENDEYFVIEVLFGKIILPLLFCLL